MKKEYISIVAFIAVLIIGLIRFFDSSIYQVLSSSTEDVIREPIKKALFWGVFFGGSIAAIIILFKKIITRKK